METTDGLLFALLRSALCGEPPATDCFAPLTAEAWETLFGEAQRQNVAALAWDGIAQMPEEVHPPKPTRIYWKAECQKTIDGALHKHEVTKGLVEFFAAEGINTYVLKGDRLSACYPKPELRRYNDIDIYQGDLWRRGDELVAQRLGAKVEKEHHHHTCYNVEGEKVENHYHLLNHYKYRSNVRYEREMLRYFGTVTFDALFLLRHTACHFAVDRIGVRHLCDWMQFVRRQGDEVDWGVVHGMCSRFGMERFFAVLQHLVAEQLHYSCVIAESAAGSPDGPTMQRVLDDIFSPPATSGAFRTFYQNQWKHRLVFTDPIPFALAQRFLSTITHG